MPRKNEKQAKRDARSARRRNQTRDEILDAARVIVLRDGHTAFTLAAVAEELGLTNPALYYYFKSKESLLVELCIREWLDLANEVEAAVAEAETAAAAVDRLMRTVFERYRDHLDLFMLVNAQLTEMSTSVLLPPFVERIRPTNEKLYGRAEELVAAAQKEGLFPKDRSPRRFVFTAHMAVIGVLTMKAMTASANDPLIHSDKNLIDEICATFTSAAGGLS